MWPATYEEWLGEDMNGPPEGLFADDDMYDMLGDHDHHAFMLLYLANGVGTHKIFKKCTYVKRIKTAPISMHQSNMC